MTLLVDYHKLKLGKYKMPAWDGLCYPTLLYLQDRSIHSGLEIKHAVADGIGLPDNLRQKTYDNSTKTTKVIEDRVSWACSDMFIAKMLQRPKRGHYQITDLGLKLLKQYGISINRHLVHQQLAYQEHRQAVLFKKRTDVPDNTSVDNLADID